MELNSQIYCTMFPLSAGWGQLPFSHCKIIRCYSSILFLERGFQQRFYCGTNNKHLKYSSNIKMVVILPSHRDIFLTSYGQFFTYAQIVINVEVHELCS